MTGAMAKPGKTEMQKTDLNSAGPAQLWAALFVFSGMCVAVGSALAFQHIGGYVPCALCLEQRIPYYIGIPFVAVGFISALVGLPACLTRGMLAIGFFCLLATGAMGFYHAGVEWGWFPGPEGCTAGLSATSSDAGSLLDDLSGTKPPSCDDAAGRFLGLSFAGWNVIAAAILAVAAFRGAFGPAGLPEKLTA